MTETFVTITDLCGRETPQTVPFYTLDDETKDTLGELMDENDGPTFYIGEFQYDLSDAPARVFDDRHNLDGTLE